MASLVLGVVMTIATVGLHTTVIALAVKVVEWMIARGFTRGGLIRKALAIQILVLFLLGSHLLQIGLWATLFLDRDEFADYEAAYYHSATNYTSLGYGDVVMSERSHLLGPLETVAGMLMFGLSTAVMFASMTREVEADLELAAKAPSPQA